MFKRSHGMRFWAIEARPGMLLWNRFLWRLHPRSVTSDAAYGTRENVAAIEKAGIRAYVALPDQGKGTSLLTKDAFAYDGLPVHFSILCRATLGE